MITSLTILPSTKDANNDPTGLQAMITPMTVLETPLSLAKGGKNGPIMDFDKHSRNPQKVRIAKATFLFIL